MTSEYAAKIYGGGGYNRAVQDKIQMAVNDIKSVGLTDNLNMPGNTHAYPADSYHSTTTGHTTPAEHAEHPVEKEEESSSTFGKFLLTAGALAGAAVLIKSGKGKAALEMAKSAVAEHGYTGAAKKAGSAVINKTKEFWKSEIPLKERLSNLFKSGKAEPLKNAESTIVNESENFSTAAAEHFKNAGQKLKDIIVESEKTATTTVTKASKAATTTATKGAKSAKNAAKATTPKTKYPSAHYYNDLIGNPATASLENQAAKAAKTMAKAAAPKAKYTSSYSYGINLKDPAIASLENQAAKAANSAAKATTKAKVPHPSSYSYGVDIKNPAIASLEHQAENFTEKITTQTAKKEGFLMDAMDMINKRFTT